MKKNWLKTALLTCSACFWMFGGISASNAEVTVTRDALGVPFIDASTDHEMWFAFGYVQARDRIIQMEILRQNAFGELPELVGDGDNENAKRVERNLKQHHKYPNLRYSLFNEIRESKDVDGKVAMHCMAAGINQFKSEIDLAAEPNKEGCLREPFNPKVFGNRDEHQLTDGEVAFIKEKNVSLKLNKRPWSPVDIAGLFHLQVMDEYSNRNTEMNNLIHLLELSRVNGEDTTTAVKVFNSMKWALNENAATTIPASLRHTQNANNMANIYHSNLIRTVAPKNGSYNGCTVYNPATFQTSYGAAAKYAMHEKNDLFPMKASNWWVVSQPYAGKGVPTGVMYNGPQIAALDPSRTYQVALKSDEGFQFAGNTYPGTINFWQGHNGNLAMGLTAGNIDVSDIFCVDLFNEGDRLFYKTENGRSYIQPSKYQPIRAVVGAPTAPLFNVVGHNWPVVMIDENKDARQGDPVGTAYIQRYNWEGSTVSTLTSWMDALNAKTLTEWNNKLGTVGANFNLVALQADGKASYRLTGSLPIKRGMQQPNPVLPATEWDYFPSYDPRLPAAIAPEDGWNIVGKYYHGLRYDIDNGILANWNQKPFVNMPDGDLDYDSYFRFDRVTLIKNMLKDPERSGPETVSSVLELNGLLQRLDVNYFAFKPFWKRLFQISEQPIQKQALFQIGNWGGQRGSVSNPEVDQLGAHYGHVLFYEWMNALTEQFASVIAKSDKNLTTHLMKGLLKPKQPYLPTIKNGMAVKPRATILTSHGIHVNARIMLNALHSAFKISQSETESGAAETRGYQYTYDRYQENLLNRVNPEQPTQQNAFSVMLSSLDTAIEKTRQYPGFSEKQFVSGDNSYMSNDIRTYSGMSSTLGRNDVSIGFRPDSIIIPHFRNRGPLNIAVQFLDGIAQGKNIAHPGIREFRNAPGAGSENHSGNDFSYNQIDMYEKNQYRDMHPLPHSPLHKSKL